VYYSIESHSYAADSNRPRSDDVPISEIDSQVILPLVPILTLASTFTFCLFLSVPVSGVALPLLSAVAALGGHTWGGLVVVLVLTSIAFALYALAPHHYLFWSTCTCHVGF